MSTKKEISEVMAELGRRSGRKQAKEKGSEYYSELSKKSWENRRKKRLSTEDSVET